ncbi:MAG: septum formation initiator family protein [Paludibacteraceae bacterium]|nr:septum formation initiator family protein [Paludibacteraceae bacterium]
MLNKYVLICLIFAIVLTFCGDQSLINRFRRERQISQLEEEIELYEKRLDDTRRSIETLQSGKEELERYARERYLMHEDGEQVYVVEEEK